MDLGNWEMGAWLDCRHTGLTEMARDNSSFEGGKVLDRIGGLEPGYCEL